MAQEVDSLAVRLADSAPTSLDSAQRLAKEVGVLSDVSRHCHRHTTQLVALMIRTSDSNDSPHCVCVAGGG